MTLQKLTEELMKWNALQQELADLERKEQKEWLLLCKLLGLTEVSPSRTDVTKELKWQLANAFISEQKGRADE